MNRKQITKKDMQEFITKYMDDSSISKIKVLRALLNKYNTLSDCPHDYLFNDHKDCKKAYFEKRKKSCTCEECWFEAVKEFVDNIK